VVELCAGNYATSDGLVNVTNGVFKTSTTYYEKTNMWIQKLKIRTKTK
jgi:hypothetical protein